MKSESCSVMFNSMTLPGYSVHGILQTRIQEWAAFPFSRGSSQPRSPALRADSLPAEPQGKPKNTGMGSLSLLQGVFLTQELNWCLLHCSWILYQLSCQGNHATIDNGTHPLALSLSARSEGRCLSSSLLPLRHSPPVPSLILFNFVHFVFQSTYNLMNSLFSSEKSLVNISNNVFLKDAVSNTDIPVYLSLMPKFQ